MKRLKDFAYNISDILVALLILVISTGVIIWRLEKIIEYPEKVLVDNDVYYDDIDGEVDDTDPQIDDEKEKVEEQVDESIYDEEGKLVKDITLTLPKGSTAKGVIKVLVDAGLLESYSEYEKICNDNGLVADKVKSGNIKFRAGLTKEEVALGVNLG